jgi:hypothetical protein
LPVGLLLLLLDADGGGGGGGGEGSDLLLASVNSTRDELAMWLFVLVEYEVAGFVEAKGVLLPLAVWYRLTDE